MALSTSHQKLALIYQARGDSQLAIDEFKTALKLRESVLDGAPDNVEIQKKVLDIVEPTAQLESSLGDDKAAIDAYRRALPVMEQLARRDPTNTDWKYQRGNILADLGFALIDSGEFKEASHAVEQAIEVQKELVAKDPKSTRYRIALSRSYSRDGDGHARDRPDRRGDAAVQDRARDPRASCVARMPTSVAFRRSFAWCVREARRGVRAEERPRARARHARAGARAAQAARRSSRRRTTTSRTSSR